MNIIASAFAALLLATPVLAEEGLDPIDPAAIELLKRAYHLNGDSMVGWGSIEVPPTPKIMHPVEKWTRKNALDAAADELPSQRYAVDICTLHRMHKVYNSDRSSWKCRK